MPPDFRFSVKLPKTITHTARLERTEDLLVSFLGAASVLGEKLGCLLVQLPPSLSFDAVVVERFCETLRGRTAVAIACEPRHASWFAEEPERLLARLGESRGWPLILHASLLPR